MLRLRSPWLGLTPRFGWHRLHWSKDYFDSMSLNDCLKWNGALSLSVLVPIANQTGFHATTAVKARRPCSRICTSLPYRQTSGHKCVLQRATSIQVRVDAVATVVIYSFEAIVSPPVQREGKSSTSDCLIATIDPQQQHQEAGTRFAGRDQSPSVVVADRRSKKRIEMRPLLSVPRKPKTGLDPNVVPPNHESDLNEVWTR